MSSLEDLAAVRTAIELFNNSELKTEVLSAPGSGYGNYKKCGPDNYHVEILEWKLTSEKKTANILETLGVIKKLWGKVTEIVILIATRIVMWAEYHEETLGLSRDFNSKFFNSSFLTSQGFVDNKKAAEELTKDESISIKQKYKLACLHCLTEHIPDSYNQMSQEDKEEFCDDQKPERINQPEIVTFWSYYLMDRVDELRGEKTLDEYRLQKSIESGSKAAVEYCLEEASLSGKEGTILDAALEAVRNKRKAVRSVDQGLGCRIYTSEFCIPRDNFVDILCFLLSKMKEDQKIEFLKKDVEGRDYEIADSENPRHSTVLTYLLDWPYQYCFMETAQLMWEFLPERSFADLLFKICEKMNPEIIYLGYSEEKTYDYMKLLREFWCQSPDHYKRYTFSDKEITNWDGDKKILNEGKSILCKLFKLNNFSYEDWKVVELLLESATDEEKENIISSEEEKDICIWLIEKEKWQFLDLFVSNCLPSKEKAEEFKRGLSSTEAAQRVCINFMKGQKWDAVELFVGWSSLAEGEVIRLKREMAYSELGRKTCMDLFLYRADEVVNRFCECCFFSEDEVRKFKKELMFSNGLRRSSYLVTIGELEVVEKFINWSLCSIEEIRQFRKLLP